MLNANAMTVAEVLDELKEHFDYSDAAQWLINHELSDMSDTEELISHVVDIVNYGAYEGTIDSLTYYYQTSHFYTKFSEEIHLFLANYEAETGMKVEFEWESFANTASWFYAEYLFGLMMGFLEG